LRYEGALSHFAPPRVNDTLTLDFDNDTKFESHHYAFKVDEAEFDGILVVCSLRWPEFFLDAGATNLD
jgi:hypothetical protein